MQNKNPHVIVCDKLSELGDTIDAITVNGKIASDRSVMLILNAKRTNKNVKIFVLADKGLSEDKVRIMDYGADAFAVKPMSMESMINKVNMKLLEAAKSAAASASV
jgi:DNA-binding response OmpR family regulator